MGGGGKGVSDHDRGCVGANMRVDGCNFEVV